MAMDGGYDEQRAKRQEERRASFSAWQQEFWKATRENRVGDMAELLAAGADPNEPEPTDGGAYPVHRACLSPSDEALRLLIRAGARLDRRDEEGSSPMHFACTDFESMMSRHFPSASGPIGGGGERGGRPLALLLELGCPVGDRNRFGYEPLHTAASVGFEWGVRALLAAGASASARDEQGRWPEEVSEAVDEGRLSGLLRAARERQELGMAPQAGPSARRGL